MLRVRTAIVGGGGGPYLSTFYFSDLPGDAQDAAVATRAFWEDIRDHVWTGLTMTVEAEVAVLDDASGELSGLAVTATSPVTGNNGGEPVPWATQGLIRWRTGTYKAGREIRGRTFLPGVCEGDNTVGAPSAAYVSAINAAAATLIADTTASLQSWTRANNDAAPVISGTVWSSWASLRSRRD